MHYLRLSWLLFWGQIVTRTTHVEEIFRKCSLFVKKLRRLSTLVGFIRKFVKECVLPMILNCSPAIFPGFLKHSIKLINRVCGLSFSHLTNFVCDRHNKASSNFVARILVGHLHPCLRTYRRQGHTFPPGAVSSCYLRRLLRIGILPLWHCQDFRLAETRSWVTTYRSRLVSSSPFPNCTIKHCAHLPSAVLHPFTDM